ncbi:hypothetical protein V2J09_007730 [Rumex salicifolius]
MNFPASLLIQLQDKNREEFHQVKNSTLENVIKKAPSLPYLTAGSSRSQKARILKFGHLMDAKVVIWIIEFLIEQRVDDRVLDRLLATLPVKGFDYRMKKVLLLRRLQSELSKGLPTTRMLDMLEIIGELDKIERKVPSENMRDAYCAVAVDCTVRHLETADYKMYAETVENIWRWRIRKMGEADSSSMVDERTRTWKDDIEAAISNMEIRGKCLSTNTRYEALRAVRCYLEESYKDLGPSFVQKTANNVHNMGKAGKGVDGISEDVIEVEEIFKGLEDVTEAQNGLIPSEKPSVDETGKEQGYADNVNEAHNDADETGEEQGSAENVNEAHNGVTRSAPCEKLYADEIGVEQGFEGLENVNEAHIDVTPCGPCEKPSEDEIGEEQGSKGLEKNVNEAHNGLTTSGTFEMPSVETPHKQLPQKRKHVGVHKKVFHKTPSKAKLSNTEDLDIDTRMNKYPCIPTPEVDKTKADLKSSFVDLNAAVKDPLPEAIKIAEQVSLNLKKDNNVGGNHGSELNVDSTDHGRAKNLENIRDDGHPEREKRGNGNQSLTNDPFEFSENTLPNPLHLRSPTRAVRISPFKNHKIARRVPRKWTILEEDTLRKGVQEFGRGNWKAIMMEYHDVFEERTEVDLKDKWRNMSRKLRRCTVNMEDLEDRKQCLPVGGLLEDSTYQSRRAGELVTRIELGDAVLNLFTNSVVFSKRQTEGVNDIVLFSPFSEKVKWMLWAAQWIRPICFGSIYEGITSTAAMATASTPNTHLLKTPSRLQTPHLPLNAHLSYKPKSKPISITCSATQDQDRAVADRVFNFAAGPAILPVNVLQEAQSDLLNWNGSGMSVMEMSHRGKEFTSIIEKAESDLRSLLQIPSDYHVLFLQGGATSQFAAIPLNLCKVGDSVDYLVTGSWGDKAAKEAKKYAKSNVVWSGKSENYVRIPGSDEFEQNPDANYLHICANETIHGVEFKDYPTPKNKNGLLIADMSSNFCSKPVDVTKFGLIYSGVQKNVGPAGVTVVIVRKDLVGKAQEITPVMMDYKIHADNKSLYNTPPCFGIYMCGLVFADLLKQGGLIEPKQIHEIKDFLLTARRKDARSVKIKRSKDVVKFKVRCSKYLYTLCVFDTEKADKLKQSLPPGLNVQDL